MVSGTIVYALNFELHVLTCRQARKPELSDQNTVVYATSVLLGTISKFAIDETYLLLS